MRYDLVVIGSSSAGQSGALTAAALNKRVALIEHKGAVSGKTYCPSGAVSSRILREAVVQLVRERTCAEAGASGDGGSSQRTEVTMRDLKRQVQHLVDRATYAMHDQLDRGDVDLFRGSARFARPHDVIVATRDGETRLEAQKVLIACGTKPLRPARIPFDGRRVFDADQIVQLPAIPRSLIVVGAGITGIESAILLATLGVRVTVVDACDRPLESCDRDIAEVLVAHARALGMTFHLGAEVIGIDGAEGDRVAVHFADGRPLIGEHVLYAAGRVGNTDELDLSAAGLEPDDRGRLWCDEEQRTWAAHIFGAGDVVGFPLLAGTFAEQGRRAVCHAFGQPYLGGRHMRSELNTIPPVAMAGHGEEQLARERVAYGTGIVRLRSGNGIANGDAPQGLLKLLFDEESRRLLGVHCIGDTAAEAVRIGQAVMAEEGTLGEFCRRAIHTPATAGLCRGAALGGQGRLRVDRPADMVTAEPHAGGRGAETPAPELEELVAV